MSVPDDEREDRPLRLFRRLRRSGVPSPPARLCEHLEAADPGVAARTPGVCEACVDLGTRWTHLRRCLTCGAVGCCDSDPHRHATAHYESTGHPVMQSQEPGEQWRWCYVDQLLG